MAELAQAFTGLKAAIELSKTASNLVSDFEKKGPQKRALDIQLAADKLRLSTEMVEAELAKSFGYKLCKCTFPPQICLTVSRQENGILETAECPNCKTQYEV